MSASAHGGGNPTKVLRAALLANLAIAIVKFVAAYLSGSTATLAEAVHSVADTGNQVLLMVGVRLAAKHDEKRYAFGRSTEAYFFPFVVALLLFSVGGTFAVYEGIHKALNPSPPDLSDFFSLRKGPLTSLIVLGASAGFESFSCYIALKEFRASVGGREKLSRALFSSKDPTIPLVLLEDISALVGLTIAFIAVSLSALTGNGIFDAIGSIIIGLVLMSVAWLIGRDAHDLLIGERAKPEMEHRVQAITEATPGVRRVTQILTLHRGPAFILLAMKIAFDPTSALEKVEAQINEIEARIRRELPEMKLIFIEPDSHGDLRGVISEPGSHPRPGSDSRS